LPAFEALRPLCWLAILSLSNMSHIVKNDLELASGNFVSPEFDYNSYVNIKN